MKQIALLSLLAVSLQAQVFPPAAGVVRFGGLPLQSLVGVTGNLLPLPAQLGSADAVSFSDTAGLISTAGEIRLMRRDGSLLASYPLGAGPVLLGSDPSALSALAWLPGTHSLLWWDAKSFQPIPIDDSGFEGAVTSVHADTPKSARLLIARPDGSVFAARISLPAGTLVSIDFVPGVAAPAFEFGSYRISSDAAGLALSAAGSAAQIMPFPSGLFTFEQMSSSWVHLYVPQTGQHWAIHLNSAAASLSRIPAPVTAARENR